MKRKKRIDILNLSFIIFFSFIFLCLCTGFFLFNVLKLKDLNLNNSVFASSEINTEMLGFSDMTLSEFVNTFQKISSPDETKILKNSPKKKDKEEFITDLEKIGLTEQNIAQNLLNGNDYNINNDIELSQKQLCLFTDILFKQSNSTEYNNVLEICGENAIEVKNINLYKQNDNYFIDVTVCINIENIRNKIFENFGYPVFEICGKLYFQNIYSLNINGNKIESEIISTTIYDTDKQISDKLINALFTCYYLTDTENKYVIDYEFLSQELQNTMVFSLNNMGNISIKEYTKNNKDYISILINK